MAPCCWVAAGGRCLATVAVMNSAFFSVARVSADDGFFQFRGPRRCCCRRRTDCVLNTDGNLKSRRQLPNVRSDYESRADRNIVSCARAEVRHAAGGGPVLVGRPPAREDFACAVCVCVCVCDLDDRWSTIHQAYAVGASIVQHSGLGFRTSRRRAVCPSRLGRRGKKLL